MAISSKKPKVIETKTFSEIPGFSFEYPVFKGWEVKEIKKVSGNEYHIDLNVGGVKNSKIIVLIRLYTRQIPPSSSNPKKVKYIYTKENSLFEIKNYAYVTFYEGSYNYWISLEGISQKDGFPVEQFFNKIIETFKFE